MGKMSAAKLSKALIANALAAARSAGLEPSAMRIGGDGSLTLDFSVKALDPVQPYVTATEDRPKQYGFK
jgi:hypothetical protein